MDTTPQLAYYSLAFQSEVELFLWDFHQKKKSIFNTCADGWNKLTLAHFPPFFMSEEEVWFFCQLPIAMRDETWTFDRCLFEYQTALWRPADGRQIAFQAWSAAVGEPIIVLQRNGRTNHSSAWASLSSWPSSLEQASVDSLSSPEQHFIFPWTAVLIRDGSLLGPNERCRDEFLFWCFYDLK